MGGQHQKGTAEGLEHRGCCMCRRGNTGHQVNTSPRFPHSGCGQGQGKGSEQSTSHPRKGATTNTKVQLDDPLPFYISLAVSFSVLFIFSYKIMSKQPSARGT